MGMNEIATTATPTALTSSTTDLLLDGNRQAAAAFTAGHLAAPPVRNLAIVTCMDARIEPLRQLGLGLGDTHLLRNAGGRVTDDVLRSLMVSTAALGVREVAVMQHLSCGMGKLSDAQLREKVLETTGFDPGALEFLSFTDIEASVRADVERVRNHPGVAAERVIGLVYDVATGLIHEVN
jgi:carbonic anhydrase